MKLPYSLSAEQLLLAAGTAATFALQGAIRTRESWWPLVRGLIPQRLPWFQHNEPGTFFCGQWLSDQARQRHTHIVGATGSGKTVAIEHLLFSDLARGYGALIIDPKGDREFFERVQTYCASIGRADDLSLLSATYPEESVRWNPCGLGGVSELQSKFYNSAIYSEPHYAKACEAGLLKAFTQLVREYPQGFSITHLVATLEAMAKSTKDKTLEGLFFDLFNLAQGEWRDILMCGDASDNKSKLSQNEAPQIEVSLLEVTQGNKILFVHLPTESRAVQSSRIGRLLTQEIMTISGLRKTNPEIRSGRPFSVYIDEFDAFATESIATFINKGRSSDFMIHMAHQTLSDLNRVSPDFKGQIMGNCNVRLIFRQDDPDDAETWSRVFGTKSVMRHTAQTQGGMQTGMGSTRETREFKVSPDEIKELSIGRCIFYVKTDGRLRKLKVPRPLRLEKNTKGRSACAVTSRGAGDSTDIAAALPKIRFDEIEAQPTPKQALSTDPYAKLKQSFAKKEEKL